MRPSLQAPASVNVTLALPSSACSSRLVGRPCLRYIKAPLGQFRYTGGVIGCSACGAVLANTP